MTETDTLSRHLPRDAQSILELAARSMFHLFSTISQGMFLVDRTGRIVWVNEGYKRFLPDLGFSSVDQFVGHMVEEVIPNTQMRRVLETGEPYLIDLLTNKAGTFVVSRIPLREEGSGEIIGAIGIVLFDHPETTLQPLISKFALLQRDLDDARRELASRRRTKYTFASFVGASPAAVEVKRQARRAAQSSRRVQSRTCARSMRSASRSSPSGSSPSGAPRRSGMMILAIRIPPGAAMKLAASR